MTLVSYVLTVDLFMIYLDNTYSPQQILVVKEQMIQ